MKSNLPQGWYWGTVADIYDTVKTTINPTSSESVPYIGLEHLSKGGGIDSIGSSKELQSIKAVFQADDVLYGKLRPYLNKHAVVDFTGVCSTDILVFRSKDRYPARLLDFYLGSPSVVQYANEHSKGINLPRVNAGALLAMPMPIPPLGEASRIVAQLDAVMQKFEASQERLDKLPDLLKRFRQAVLAAAVSGKLTEAWRAEQPQGETGADLLDRIRAERRAQWEEKQRAKLSGKQLNLNDSWKSKYEEPAAPDTSELPELPKGWVYVSVEQLTNGGRPSSYGVLIPGDDISDGVPMVRVGDINGGKVDFLHLKKISPSIAADYKRTQLEGGELLITLVGTIGRTAIAPPEVAGANTARAVGVIPLVEAIDKHWIEFYFRNPDKVVEMITKSHEVARKTLNLDDVRRTAVVIPPITEQEEIVHQVNHYFGLADQLEARFEQAAALVEQLPQALLAKAFSGQLVPQDPDDEPASVQLEQLQAEPAAPVKGKRGRKAKVAGEAPLFE